MRGVSLSSQLAQRLGLANFNASSAFPPTVHLDPKNLRAAVLPYLRDPEIADQLGSRRIQRLEFLIKQNLANPGLEHQLNALVAAKETVDARRAVSIPVVPIKRIFVPNRGEAASRLIAAARELSAERGEKIQVVVMYADDDREAPFVMDADIAIRIPPEKINYETITDEKTGEVSRRPLIIYNDYAHIRGVLEAQIRDLEVQGLSAANIGIWPGWGFQSEREELSELVSSLGAKFMGPSPQAMRQVGDKIGFKRLADSGNTTWSGGSVETPHQAIAAAKRLGYPVVIKATAGGGGKGIKFASNEQELLEKLPIAREEAGLAFKDPTVFVEKAVMNAPGHTVRHVEIQIIADHHGNVVAVGDRDCSAQRDNQKVVEESPAVGLSATVRQKIHAEAIRIVREAGYRGGAATVEGLYIQETGEFQPMELNARLQVEHTITEQVTGVDLVKEMIRVAEGRPLSFKSTPQPRGVALEIRICAEDPEQAFAATGGVLRTFRPPTGPGVRVDTGVRQGMKVTIGFDSMIAKLIVTGATREEAIARAQRALKEFAIDGVVTNRGLALEILSHPEFQANTHSTKWLERYMQERKAWEVKPHNREALMVAGILAKLEQNGEYNERVLATMSHGRPPSVISPKESKFKFSLNGHDYDVEVKADAADKNLVFIDGIPFEVGVSIKPKASDNGPTWEGEIKIGGQKFQVIGSQKRGDFSVSVNGIPFQVSKPAMGEVEATSNGKVMEVKVQVGEPVKAGDVLMVIEVMKLKQEIKAPIDGVVDGLKVGKDFQVTEGSILASIRPPDQGEVRKTEAPRMDFAVLPASFMSRLLVPEAPNGQKENFEKSLLESVTDEELRDHFDSLAGSLTQGLLGYDVFDLFHQLVPKKYDKVRALSPCARRTLRLMERAFSAGVEPKKMTESVLTALESFVDVETLFQKSAHRGALTEKALCDEFYEYLKSRQTGPRLESVLKAALNHYGIGTLETSPRANDALVRMLLAQENRDMRVEIAQRLLKMLKVWNERGVLDASSPRLIAVLEKFRHLDRDYNALSHASEEIVFALEEKRLGPVAREKLEARFAGALAAALQAAPGSPEHRAAVQSMALVGDIDLAPLLSRAGAAGVEGDAVREALFLCYHAERHAPESHESFSETGRWYSWGVFRDRERTEMLRGSLGVQIDLKGGQDPKASLLKSIEVLGKKIRSAPLTPVSNNLEVSITGSSEISSESLKRMLEEALKDVPKDLDLYRITVTTVGPDGKVFPTLTFRKSENGFEEDPLFHGIHPFQASQIELWRLRKHFKPAQITLPWDGTRLFLAAQKGGDDRRLIASSVLTSLSPIRDGQGSLVGFEEADLAFGRAIHALRYGLEREGKGSENHRIQLVVRTDLIISPEELDRVIKRLSGKFRGLGIEQVSIRFHKIRFSEDKPFEDRVLMVRNSQASGPSVQWAIPSRDEDQASLRPMSAVDRKTRAEANRGRVYAYEFLKKLTEDRGSGSGQFQEFDLENIRVERTRSGEEKVAYDLKTDLKRGPGENKSGIVFGLVTRKTPAHPEGITVMQIVNDASNKVCPLTEAECARIVAAIDYAEKNGLEIDWKTTSSGAGISMNKGTENLDWTSRVMKRIGEFCDGGGVINILAESVNVGAQAYWIANAVMLPNRKGVLIMTPDSAAVLTGNEGQKIAGSVGAKDNVGLGGAERIMGPNGENQFLVRDIGEGADLLWKRRDLNHRRPGRFIPRLRETSDPLDRDVTEDQTVRLIVRDAEKKTPFPVSALMNAVEDRDAPVIPQRWDAWKRGGADLIQVRETVIGGVPVMQIGIEARSTPRNGDRPAGYPPVWSGATLFPEGSKKMAHALNAASGVQPAVILANLSGFDGSPESLLNNQLEWGTEIEEAIRKFQGPIVFLVTTRYHGGAYVVFSKVLNPDLYVGALEGTFASVIGPDPAVQLVFPKDIDRETDKRIKDRTASEDLLKALDQAVSEGDEEKIAAARAKVRAIVAGEYKAQYDQTHTVERALKVGSIHEIVSAERMRPWIIHRLYEGLKRYQARMVETANGLFDSLSLYYARQKNGNATWESIVRFHGFIPHLPALAEGNYQNLEIHSPVPLREWNDDNVSKEAILEAGKKGEGFQRKPALEVSEGVGTNVLSYGRVDTTMATVRDLMTSGFKPGLAVIADRQDNGRGRNDHRWESPAGANLYASIWIDPKIADREAAYLSYTVAGAVARALRDMTEADVQVKWPNDLYIGGKKIGGILIENVPGQGYIVGIGLNINADVGDFSEDIARVATSLKMIDSQAWNRDLAAALLMDRLDEYVERYKNGEWEAIRGEINGALYQQNRRVAFSYEGQREEGTVITVDEEGGLLIRNDAGLDRRLFDGSVEIVG